MDVIFGFVLFVLVCAFLALCVEVFLDWPYSQPSLQCTGMKDIITSA